jgi:diguanylate cyclase (GGDEF)-like protein/PAS domain S-box-containing protein
MSSGPAHDSRSLEIALNAMPVGVSWATLADQKIIFMNRKFTEIFGYVMGDFSIISDWIGHYPYEEDRELASQRWSEYFAAPCASEFLIRAMELRIRCKDGSIKTIIHHGVILPDAGWALATFVDITDRKRDEIFLREAAREARESQIIYRTLLDHSAEMIVLSPFDRSRRYVSPAVTGITGFTPAEYLALNQRDVTHPDDLAPVRDVVACLRRSATSIAFRYRALHKDGSYRWVEAVATSYLDPSSQLPGGIVATVRDISGEIERQKHIDTEHRRLADAAVRDELTGIANRRAFNQALASEASRSSRSEGDLSLLIIDVDHFKLYNDHWGHPEGDACLLAVAQAIDSAVSRATDLVARFGGEEFVVLAPMTNTVGAATIACRILEQIASLELPHPAAKRGIVTVSIGATTWPAGVRLDQAKLIEQADRALYIAKSEGRNAFRYLPLEAA